MTIQATLRSRGFNMGGQSMHNALHLTSVERSGEIGVNIPPQQLSSNTGQIKAWNEFCDLNNIFPRYRQVSIDTLKIANDENGESFQDKARRWIHRPRSLILQGKAGRGKTHYMFSLIREMFLVKNLQIAHIRYFDHVSLDRRLQEQMMRYKSSIGLIQQLCEVPILVLDDFGIDCGTQRHERDFYEVFNKRFGNNLITIISTNMTEAEISKSYGERIASRFREAALIEFNGPDLRG